MKRVGEAGGMVSWSPASSWLLAWSLSWSLSSSGWSPEGEGRREIRGSSALLIVAASLVSWMAGELVL
jgi:hypothetical protein